MRQVVTFTKQTADSQEAKQVENFQALRPPLFASLNQDVNLGYALGSFETPSSLVRGSAPHVTSMLLTCS